MSTPFADLIWGEPGVSVGSNYERVRAAVGKLSQLPSDERAFWRDSSGRVFVNLHDTELTSAFLPVQEVDSGDLLGHFVQLVDRAGKPAQFRFDQLDDDGFIATDRLLRALHTLNYFGCSTEPIRLFLDVNHRFFSSISDNHGRAFRHLIESLGLLPGHFVIQVVASDETDLNTLAFAADNYRRNGFLTGLYCRYPLQSRSLIAQIRPDFLSLWIDEAWCLSELPDIVDAANSFRVKLIARNIQNQSQVFGLRQAGVNLLQLENSISP
ncbi:EAL domain-containing protein (putative c-di-GMP-specific phosphodiesterase class I) [Limnobacter thiooxidans]|uniref:EAL domain-containing protein n=1 Tax=Limnobacter thiooxidans TaxID=131080 RepID=A0AA86J075_9BURK|nr:EAL domain-containing protein (putative c-di-GMP-specific phosphodiesterase class I) [Limnobacter thiooxidans]BET27004.1 hypothetical protein RGQ30_25050 [Limnobacter thiooxidans]